MDGSNSIPTFGRTVIYSDALEITRENVVEVLNAAYLTHLSNRKEIEYLWQYYKGIQPILSRVKKVRPEICNKIVENRANEIVSFKTGYLMGEPVQYVAKKGAADGISKSINLLNEYMFAEEKQSKDEELADWFHICGTSYRMVLPDAKVKENDESPFEIYIPDPRSTFIVYSNSLGNKPLMGVQYVVDKNGITHFFLYTDSGYYEVTDGAVTLAEVNTLGEIPIVEYPLNKARLGAFEIVLPLLDGINTMASNRIDALEQTVQALLVFYNIALKEGAIDELREKGAIQVSDIDPNTRAKIEYLINNISQGEAQTTISDMYEAVLTICGMPNRNGGSSTSDTGAAVIMRDGWSSAEARAKHTENMFKKSERKFLKIALNICCTQRDIDLKVSDVEIRFTRRNYENIVSKSQVLTTMLANDKIHPRLAFIHSGMFVDPEVAYAESEAYYNSLTKEVVADDGSGDNSGDEGTDRESAETRQSS